MKNYAIVSHKWRIVEKYTTSLQENINACVQASTSIYKGSSRMLCAPNLRVLKVRKMDSLSS